MIISCWIFTERTGDLPKELTGDMIYKSLKPYLNLCRGCVGQWRSSLEIQSQARVDIHFGRSRLVDVINRGSSVPKFYRGTPFRQDFSLRLPPSFLLICIFGKIKIRNALNSMGYHIQVILWCSTSRKPNKIPIAYNESAFVLFLSKKIPHQPKWTPWLHHFSAEVDISPLLLWDLNLGHRVPVDPDWWRHVRKCCPWYLRGHGHPKYQSPYCSNFQFWSSFCLLDHSRREIRGHDIGFWVEELDLLTHNPRATGLSRIYEELMMGGLILATIWEAMMRVQSPDIRS